MPEHTVFGSVRQWVSEFVRLENLVNIIFQKPMKGISPNFGHRCIWVHCVPISFWDQRSTVIVIAGNEHNVPDEYNIFVNIWTNFVKIRSRMYQPWNVLIRSKVKDQGYSRQWPKNLVNTISHKSLKGIFPNFGHICIWVHRYGD